MYKTDADGNVLTDADGKPIPVKVKVQGGVIQENVTFDADGNLILIANGDLYVGDKQGVPYGADESIVSGGQRTGAKVQSANTYGPGSFEVTMKIPVFSGICTSMWLYNNFGGANYEIDIEIHGTAVRNGQLLGMDNGSTNIGSTSTPLFTTWVTERDYTSEYKNVGYNLADGQFHKYRIDWHTGDNPYIEYYIDDVLVCTQTTNVPTNEMYPNIGCWFPRDWCGQPTFETDYAVVKSFTYTPFAGETAAKENCEALQSGRFLEGITVPTTNFVANGDFAYELNKNDAWKLTDDNATYASGSLTYTGTLSQTVTMDCLGLNYALTVNGSGNCNVKVTYLSIVNDVEVTGEVTGALGETITLATPEHCTQLLIEIISNGELTVNSVQLVHSNN